MTTADLMTAWRADPSLLTPAELVVAWRLRVAELKEVVKRGEGGSPSTQLANDIEWCAKQLEAVLAEQAKTHLVPQTVCCQGCPDCLGLGYAPAVLKDYWATIQRLGKELADEKQMHDLCKAFHDVACSERDRAQYSLTAAKQLAGTIIAGLRMDLEKAENTILAALRSDLETAQEECGRLSDELDEAKAAAEDGWSRYRHAVEQNSALREQVATLEAERADIQAAVTKDGNLFLTGTIAQTIRAKDEMVREMCESRGEAFNRAWAAEAKVAEYEADRIEAVRIAHAWTLDTQSMQEMALALTTRLAAATKARDEALGREDV